MRKIEKKKLSTGKIAMILAAVLLLAVAASLIIYFTVKPGGEEQKKEPPIPLEGEDVLYNSMLIAYPTMEEKDIQYISVSNSKGSFGMVRPDKDGTFTLFYFDENGKVHEYRPKISEIDDNFNYSDLFAIETGDGYNAVTKLTYLCMSLQVPYFEERIYLSDNEEERAAQLDAYGLSEDDEYAEISFSYNVKTKNEAGEEITETKSHKLKIGSPTIIETGYYFMVDDRDIVYAGTANYFSYALTGFYSFINSILVSPGLKEDSVLSAYITTNYYQWLGEMHEKEGETVKEDSKVISFADVIVPVGRDNASGGNNGYISDGYSDIEFDLLKYKNTPGFERMLKALIGRGVGSYKDNEIIFSVVGSSPEIDFSGVDSKLYTYTVTEIEAILTDSGEICVAGTALSGASQIKVKYTLSVDGKAVGDTFHSVIDLNSASLPEDFRAALKASAIGVLPAPVSTNIVYTKDNAVARNVKYVITEIVSIYDSKGAEINKISASSIVCYRYRFMIDGVLGEEEYITTLDLGKDTSESGKAIKDALVGKGVSTGLSLVVADETVYSEFFFDFITYKLSEIKYFITNKMVSAFRFQNSSERDPFYGDSLYENTLNNKYSIYGLNHSVCQKVVNILTGISEATTTPGGLVGTETVAVGITPAVMKEYGLYANTIYFEIPRGLWAIDSGDSNKIDDYAWYETLGFTLYISEENEDGSRYIGSDLYDIVARVEGEDFVFLKYDFVNFWARRDLMLTDISNIDAATFEFYLEDMKGIYEMRLDHRTLYIGSDNGAYTTPPHDISYTEFDEITVVVTPEGECTPNKLTEYIAANGYDFVSLTELYNQLVGGGKQTYAGYDTLGTSNFKEFIEVLYFTTYGGVVPESEQAAIKENCDMIMRMSFKLSSSPWRYVFEFYRYDDRRVMVRLYQASYNSATNEYGDEFTAVSDFYISTFAFKKLVNHYTDVLDTVDINKEDAYQR